MYIIPLLMHTPRLHSEPPFGTHRSTVVHHPAAAAGSAIPLTMTLLHLLLPPQRSCCGCLKKAKMQQHHSSPPRLDSPTRNGRQHTGQPAGGVGPLTNERIIIHPPGEHKNTLWLPGPGPPAVVHYGLGHRAPAGRRSRHTLGNVRRTALRLHTG